MLTKHDDQTLVNDPGTEQGPFLILFTEEWCGPCQGLKRMLNEIESEIDIAEVEPSKCPRLKAAFDVRATPTLLYLVDGNVVDRMVGAPRSWAHLRSFARLG